MALSPHQTQEIENTLANVLRKKFSNYAPEPSEMPFHTRLLGKNRLALYSFIQSLNTTFGTSVFEPVALALAKTNPNIKNAKSQATAGNQISQDAFVAIQDILTKLTTAATADIFPNKIAEIEQIRAVCQSGGMNKVKPTKVDIWVETQAGELFLFDLKTAKPNAGGFKEYKRTLLEWAACVLADNPTVKINTLISIPYNPYAPQPYQRWTMRGLLDLPLELKVAEEFWDFLGGTGAYQDLLDIFERVGQALAPEIDAYFEKFATKS
jgi:Type II restriction endonuclease, TdeIII